MHKVRKLTASCCAIQPNVVDVELGIMSTEKPGNHFTLQLSSVYRSKYRTIIVISLLVLAKSGERSTLVQSEGTVLLFLYNRATTSVYSTITKKRELTKQPFE